MPRANDMVKGIYSFIATLCYFASSEIRSSSEWVFTVFPLQNHKIKRVYHRFLSSLWSAQYSTYFAVKCFISCAYLCVAPDTILLSHIYTPYLPHKIFTHPSNHKIVSFSFLLAGREEIRVSRSNGVAGKRNDDCTIPASFREGATPGRTGWRTPGTSPVRRRPAGVPRGQYLSSPRQSVCISFLWSAWAQEFWWMGGGTEIDVMQVTGADSLELQWL